MVHEAEQLADQIPEGPAVCCMAFEREAAAPVFEAVLPVRRSTPNQQAAVTKSPLPL